MNIGRFAVPCGFACSTTLDEYNHYVLMRDSAFLNDDRQGIFPNTAIYEKDIVGSAKNLLAL